MELQDWPTNIELPPAATACDIDDFFEGMKTRREFMIENNPYKKISEQVNYDNRRDY